MALYTRSEWSTEFTGRGEHRCRGLHRIASSTLGVGPGHARGQLQPGEKKATKDAEDEERIDIQRPSTGRTSVMGRRVEKPAPAKQSGPSGQHDDCQHDRKHANK